MVKLNLARKTKINFPGCLVVPDKFVWLVGGWWFGWPIWVVLKVNSVLGFGSDKAKEKQITEYC